MKVVEFKERLPEPNKALVEYLTELLDVANSGYVQGITIVLQLHDGECEHSVIAAPGLCDRLMLSEITLAGHDIAFGILAVDRDTYTNQMLLGGDSE